MHVRGRLLANADQASGQQISACLSAAPCLTTWPLCSATGNEAFCTGIALWAFSQQGVLQAAPLRHHAQGCSEQPALYRIKDEIDVEVDVQELRGGRWQPYRWAGGDMLAWCVLFLVMLAKRCWVVDIPEAEGGQALGGRGGGGGGGGSSLHMYSCL